MSRALASCFVFVGFATACGGQSDNAAAVAEADKVWQERCVTCHGPDGSGNGPGAAALEVKPRSFKDPTWQASVDNERIKKVIIGGGAAVGLNPAMAPNPDLANKPAVQDELVKKVRRLAQ
jgi:mono/diheme cytochrome c family protein